MSDNLRPADRIKQSFEKLNEEVRRLGEILGVKRTSSSETTKMEKTEEKNKFHKEVTAEDKKARKAAKAAEKKARAEKSIAGKAAAAAGVPQQAPTKPVTPPVVEQPKEVEVVEEKSQFHKDVTAEDKKARKAAKAAEKKARAEKSIAGKAAAPQQTPTKPAVPPSEQEQLSAQLESLNINGQERKNSADLKSAIKKSTGVEKNVRHVHNVMPSGVVFDLPKNQVKIVAQSSESDDGLSELETAVVTQLEDASSFSHVHPAFLTLLAKSEHEKIPDVETVCIEFIQAFKLFLHDWTQERERHHTDAATFAHDLDLAIRPQLAHLTQNGLWPLPFALGNTVRLLKRTIKRVSESTNGECEESLQMYLDDTLAINFSSAYKMISELLVRKIQLYKKVVVFDWCPVVNEVLLTAREQMADVQLTVIDVNFGGNGIRHVKSFTDRGYKVKYMSLKAASWAALDSAVLVLGCSAIFANGAVAAQKGALAAVLCANHYNIPVIVVAEHFKFIDKGQVFNRFALLGRQDIEFIQSDLVTAVVTDLRILGPTSAPAVLKAKALTDMA